MKRKAWELGITSAVLIGLVTFFGKAGSYLWELKMWSREGLGYTIAVLLAGWTFGLICALFIWEW